MKVILLEDIKDLGKKFDVKNIKDGYARNFLLPRNLAKIATNKAIKELEAKKAAWQKQEEGEKSKIEALAKNLAEQKFEFSLKTGDKGEVFGSVNKDDIKNKLSLPEVEVELERPIKKLGLHQVKISLGKGVEAEIKINVISL